MEFPEINFVSAKAEDLILIYTETVEIINKILNCKHKWVKSPKLVSYLYDCKKCNVTKKYGKISIRSSLNPTIRAGLKKGEALLISKEIKAKSKELKVKWSVEAATGMMAMYNEDALKQLSCDLETLLKNEGN